MRFLLTVFAPAFGGGFLWGYGIRRDGGNLILLAAFCALVGIIVVQAFFMGRRHQGDRRPLRIAPPRVPLYPPPLSLDRPMTRSDWERRGWRYESAPQKTIN